MQRVFISYSRRNRSFAERLARDLSDAGLDVWIDFRQIHAGEMWRDEIFRGLARSEIVIVALSPAAIASEWVQREANTARDQGKFIVPIMALESVHLLEQSPELNWLLDIQYVDFQDRYEEAFPELLRALPGGRRVDPFNPPDPENIPNPFKGLEAFQQTDAAYFFGREDLIRKSLDRLREDRPVRFLAVVGASGSGKSSVVRAGVIPALRRGALAGSENWRIGIFTPGNDPIDSLAQRLSPLIETRESDSIADLLRDVPGVMAQLSEEALQGAPKEAMLLLVVDQFEEVFTRASEGERDIFLRIIREIVSRPDGRALVIITMRADFFDRLSRYPDLARLFEQENMVIVTEMTPAELLRSIEGPAQAVGLVYDDGLPQRILEDVRRQPGSLPLLQYALKELYVRREGNRLTMESYEDIGGVQQALAQQAEKIYDGLTAAQQGLMRRLLLRLVEVSDTGEVTRRRVAREDLTFRDVADDAVQEIIEVLTSADARLLIASREIRSSSDQRAPTTWIEISHEALIREWERFEGWVEANAESLRFGSQLLQAANDWYAADQDPAYLLTGNRLTQAELWLQNADANQQQRAFIAASRVEEERREAVRQAQIERELDLRRKANARLLLLVGLLVVSLIVAIVLSLFAFNSLNTANVQGTAAAQARDIAESNEEQARSLALAASANRALSDDDNEIAVMLAVYANAVDEPPAQSQRTLAEVAYAPGSRHVFEMSERQVPAALLVPGDALGREAPIAVTAANRVLFLWDTASGDLINSIGPDIHEKPVNAITLSPDPTRLVAADESGQVVVWDLLTGMPVAQFMGQDVNGISDVAVSPGGSIVAGSTENTAVLWNIDGTELARCTTDGDGRSVHSRSINAIALGTDSGGNLFLASAGEDGFLALWRVTGTSCIFARYYSDGGSPGMGQVESVTFGPDAQSWLAAGFGNGLVRVWREDRPTSPRLVFQADPVDVNTLDYSPDGDLLATGADDDLVRLWEAQSGDPVETFTGHEGVINAVNFATTAPLLISASNDGTARLWDLSSGDVVRRYRGFVEPVTAVDYGPDGRLILAGGVERTFAGETVHTVRLLDSQTGLAIQQMTGHDATINDVELGPNLDTALSVDSDGLLIVWDALAGTAPMTFSHDGVGALAVRYLPGDPTQAITGLANGGLARWDLTSGEIVQTYGPAVDKDALGHLDPVQDLAITSDGQYLISASQDRTMVLWEVETGEPLLILDEESEDGHTRPIQVVTINQAGDRVVSGDTEGKVLLWQIDPAARDYTFMGGFVGHDQAIFGLDFAPDGEAVISSSLDGTMRLWDVDSRFELRRFTLDDPLAFGGLDFNEDGRTVVAGVSSGIVAEWRVLINLGELVAWVFNNRFVPEPTCSERQLFNLLPLCEGGEPVPTRTPIPTLTATPTLDVPVLVAGGRATVNTDNNDSLNLRAAPEIPQDDEANIIEKLEDGVLVDLLEGPVEQNGFTWWRVRAASGQEGWVVEDVPQDGVRTLVP